MKIKLKQGKDKFSLDDIFEFIEPEETDEVNTVNNNYKKNEERILYINEDVTDDLIDTVAYDIIAYNIEDKDVKVKDRKPIKLFINTCGGDIVPAFHLIDVINASVTPVYTYALGRANSAGGFILINGHQRFAFPHSQVLIHSGGIFVDEHIDKMYDRIENLNKMQKDVLDTITENTFISEELYRENYRREWYITGDDLLKYGIVDEIIYSLSDII